MRVSKGEWDVKVALALIFLIIAVNVVQTLLVSSDPAPSHGNAAQQQEQEQAAESSGESYGPDAVEAVPLPGDAAAESPAWPGSREELLSIISKH